MILNSARQRLSAKRKLNLSVKKKQNIKIGTASERVIVMPAVITEFCRFKLPSARYLLINRDTVMGIPDEHTVSSSAKTDNVIWYKPKPSDPIVWDRNIL